MRGGSFISHARDLPPGTDFVWPTAGISFGADYNPEQWPRSVWAEDVRLMREAGVDLVSLGVFAWGSIELDDGVYDWEWLDEIMALLGEAAIGVALATPTAAPPMWLFEAHPELATVSAAGVRAERGGRLGWHPSSAVFRRYALRFVRELARRYGPHPALRVWHLSNELGNENARSYDDETAAAWRAWLQRRYGTIEELNRAWGTAPWGHRYGAFAQVRPPRETRTAHHPGLLVDFDRFSSDALLEHLMAEREVLRAESPGIPIMTNAMIQGGTESVDYARWATELDILGENHYPRRTAPGFRAELAFSADRVRGIVAGRPWMLVEHAAGAVSWQGTNLAKSPGDLARESLAYVSRGADAVMFFQWRAAVTGAEVFHSALIGHAGERTRIFDEAAALGGVLRRIASVRGTPVERASVALIADVESAWAWRSTLTPAELDPWDTALRIHRLLVEKHVAVDVLPAGGALDGYAMLIVPALFLVTDATRRALRRAAVGGARVLVTARSGVVDENMRIWSGEPAGALADLTGVSVEEVIPLLDGVDLDQGGRATRWAERVNLKDAVPRIRFASGELADSPALTRRDVGAGSAWYLAADVDHETLERVIGDVIEEAAVTPIAPADRGLELTRRRGPEASYLFVINPTGEPRDVRAPGRDLVSGRLVGGFHTIEPGGIAVIQEERP